MWIATLRQALTAGMRSSSSILQAATDAARGLTGAQGSALALRTNGVIVCRARSGDIAPELGSRLSLDSGISGECLRTESTLVCNDAATDKRVDTAACQALGVRSIVVIPLRGATRIAGILEAFSTRPYAFGAVQLATLRELALIAEKAYERDCLPQNPLEASGGGDSLFAPPDAIERICVTQFSGESSSRRRYWIPAIVALAVLLIFMVVWWSWNGPSEISVNAPPAGLSPIHAQWQARSAPADQRL